MKEHTITLRVITPGDLPQPLGITQLNYFIVTHGWQLTELRCVKSRQLTRDEAKSISLDEVDEEPTMDRSPHHEVETCESPSPGNPA